MCGITGLLSPTPQSRETLLQRAAAMTQALVHRGPDDQGLWADGDAGIALGHRRLAIVDLTQQGHQPMVSACERYVAVYNGEIYNHLELRDELPGVAWRGHSDTETMLALFSRRGVEAALEALVGMFAIAVWDRERRELVLARDRMGEKPLYWGRLPGGEVVFGSELKALRAHPGWDGELDRNAIALYMRHNAVPAPHSVFRNVSKLLPGTWLRLRAGTPPRHGRYWDTAEVMRHARSRPLDLPDDAATDALEAVLDRAVASQMLSDVPLGAFLSGGVDSSVIVSLMRRHSPAKVRTFSIGFTEGGYDEAVHAKAVAAHLGTDHTELYVSGQDALDVVPRLPAMYDEPFADSSQIPTFLVSRMARRHVTVALSGDAGDELFAGYNRYLLAECVWRRLAPVPIALRRLAASSVLAVPIRAWAAALAPLPARHAQVPDKLHKFARSVLPARDEAAMYRALVSHWPQPSRLVLGAHEPATLLDQADFDPAAASAVEHMCLLDQQTYLPDDILVKVDRAAMAVSLETRVPMLDHRVVDFSWRVPMHQKIRDGQGKWLLRQVLYRHVPRALIERPKQGFAVPLDAWLRGPLRDWAEDLLDPARLRSDGLFDEPLVTRTWREHLGGRRNWQYLLWDVLMFQAWLRHGSPARCDPPAALATMALQAEGVARIL